MGHKGQSILAAMLGAMGAFLGMAPRRELTLKKTGAMGGSEQRGELRMADAELGGVKVLVSEAELELLRARPWRPTPVEIEKQLVAAMQEHSAAPRDLAARDVTQMLQCDAACGKRARRRSRHAAR